MNSTALIAASMGDADPELIATLTKIEEERNRKLETVIKALGKNAATGYRYLKGEPKVVDASGAEIKPEDPRFAGILLKYKNEQDVKFAALETAINGVVETALEFVRPSALEQELMGRLLAGKKRGRRPTAGEARFAD